MAAHVRHVVEAGGSAEHLAPRHRHASSGSPSPAFPGSAVYIQSVAGLSCMAAHATGISSTSGGRSPASRRATRQAGSSESRAAITAPADPPPTTMKSKVSAMSHFRLDGSTRRASALWAVKRAQTLGVECQEFGPTVT